MEEGVERVEPGMVEDKETLSSRHNQATVHINSLWLQQHTQKLCVPAQVRPNPIMERVTEQIIPALAKEPLPIVSC